MVSTLAFVFAILATPGDVPGRLRVALALAALGAGVLTATAEAA